jgi:hypothetical protein
MTGARYKDKKPHFEISGCFELQGAALKFGKF